MKLALVPGYRDLFGEPTLTYEEWMKDIPSQIGIVLAVALNGELSLSNPDSNIQQRLMAKMCHRFTLEQKQFVYSALQAYRKKTKDQYENEFFERWYLLEMVVRELNRNAVFALKDNGGQQEYNFLMAYLLVIDEVHQKQSEQQALTSQSEKDKLFPLRLIWTGLLYQYQFQEKPDPTYEFYKLSAMLSYARTNFRDQLREYLNSIGLKTIGHLMGSFLQVVQKGLKPNEDPHLPSLNYFLPFSGVDDSHLRSQAINQYMGKGLTAADLRKYPLYYRADKGYAVIDQEFNLKKVYRGPLFDLRVKTSLNTKIKGDEYNSTIAKHVMEEICLTGILKSMLVRPEEILLFDDGTNSAPDAYYREDNTILLFEFKGYLFPDKQLVNPDFDAFKKYLTERFIENQKGKPKGISQLINQIDLIVGDEPYFDKDLPKIKEANKLRIYPIICFDDFYFSMSCVNEYLNEVFLSRLSVDAKENLEIMPLTLINLDVLFYLSVRKKNFTDLTNTIVQYANIINNRKTLYSQSGLSEDLLSYHSSFDEVFHTKLIEGWYDSPSKNQLNMLLTAANITQEMLDEDI